MKTLFAVTNGCYGDYTVRCIFETEHQAKDILKLLGGGEYDVVKYFEYHLYPDEVKCEEKILIEGIDFYFEKTLEALEKPFDPDTLAQRLAHSGWVGFRSKAKVDINEIHKLRRN